MTFYVVDTHALNWYLIGDKQLSRKIKAILDNLDSGDDYVYVPTLVLAEMMVLEEKGRTTVKYNSVVSYLTATEHCTIVPITLEVVEAAKLVQGAIELFDRLIAATAIQLEAKLITRDAVLSQLKNVETVW